MADLRGLTLQGASAPSSAASSSKVSHAGKCSILSCYVCAKFITGVHARQISGSREGSTHGSGPPSRSSSRGRGIAPAPSPTT